MLNLLGFFLVFTVFLGLAGFWVIVADSAFGDYNFSTSARATLKIISIIQSHKKSHGVLYDLGSNHGKFALKVQKSLPRLEIYGLDNNSVRIFWSKAKTIFAKHSPNFLKIDIFKADISRADVVYAYLPSSLMPHLRQKLQKELKPGSMVITNTVFFDGWDPMETYITNDSQPEKEKIFVYQN